MLTKTDAILDKNGFNAANTGRACFFFGDLKHFAAFGKLSSRINMRAAAYLKAHTTRFVAHLVYFYRLAVLIAKGAYGTHFKCLIGWVFLE